MTTIVGIQQDDGIVLAADALTTSNDRPYTSKAQPKIVDNNGYLIACAGMSMACDVVQHLWKAPAQKESHTYKHIVGTVVPSLRHALHTNDVTFKDDDSLQILLALKGWLFQIESDFSVLMRTDGLYAIGSGSAYAIGALAAGATPTEAIKIAAANDIFTGLPVEIRKQRKF